MVLFTGMLRNIVYESECARCNPPGTRKAKDREGLDDSREVASLYVGETARSISERATEHWRDAEAGKEESHIMEHVEARLGGIVCQSLDSEWSEGARQP